MSNRRKELAAHLRDVGARHVAEATNDAGTKLTAWDVGALGTDDDERQVTVEYPDGSWEVYRRVGRHGPVRKDDDGPGG